MAMQLNQALRKAAKHVGQNNRQMSSAFSRNDNDQTTDAHQRSNIHVSSARTYPQAAALPLPVNIDPTETTRFSPYRSRDICGNAIALHCHQNEMHNQIDITSDNTYKPSPVSVDPHLSSYDCNGAISLNCVMQSTVPDPFGGKNKFTHLNMPGGQWQQSDKFNAQDLQASHYTNLRQEARQTWSSYGDNYKSGSFILGNRANVKTISLLGLSNPLNIYRNFSLNSYACFNKINENSGDKSPEPIIDESSSTKAPLSRSEKLKKAVKEYGSTVIVFHISISLVSLGSFYLLVSSGLDVVQILDYFGWGNAALANKIATGASTFVIAYAIHKVFAPVRISITLGATPFIVRYLRNKGILKKPPTAN